MKFLSRFLNTTAFSIFLFSGFSFAQAQGEIGEYVPPKGLPGGDTSLAEVFARASDSLVMGAVSLAVLLLIVGGIEYALAAGDEEKQAWAKRLWKWTVFGLVIALVAYGIVALVVGVIAE